MNKLDKLYCLLLKAGFLVMRQAADARDIEWLNSEIELLHNVPSLIGETNALRHEYFWQQERVTYITQANASSNEQRSSQMTAFYVPIWNEMEPLVAALGSRAQQL